MKKHFRIAAAGFLLGLLTGVPAQADSAPDQKPRKIIPTEREMQDVVNARMKRLLEKSEQGQKADADILPGVPARPDVQIRDEGNLEKTPPDGWKALRESVE